jgi:hypothetical protein
LGARKPLLAWLADTSTLFQADSAPRPFCSEGHCHAEAVSHLDTSLPATGLAASQGQYPPHSQSQARTLRVEQLAPRHLLTVDVLGSGSVAELDGGEVVQEAWMGGADSEQALEDSGPVGGGCPCCH